MPFLDLLPATWLPTVIPQSWLERVLLTTQGEGWWRDTPMSIWSCVVYTWTYYRALPQPHPGCWEGWGWLHFCHISQCSSQSHSAGMKKTLKQEPMRCYQTFLGKCRNIIHLRSWLTPWETAPFPTAGDQHHVNAIIPHPHPPALQSGRCPERPSPHLYFGDS